MIRNAARCVNRHSHSFRGPLMRHRLWLIAAALATATSSLAAIPARALDLVALGSDNTLHLFRDASPGQVDAVRISGVAGRIVGIDVRPASGRLYALSNDGNLYRIIPATGAATWVSKLSAAFDASQGAIVDWNPVADRIRIMGQGGKINFRVNADDGQVAVDKPLAYSPRDANAGKMPTVTAGAYINSVPGAKETQLFDIDSAMGAYVIQDPPNDGLLTTIGSTGLGSARVDAIDIFTDAAGNYTGFALSGNTLHRLDVGKGTVTALGPIAAGGATLIDIAVWR